MSTFDVTQFILSDVDNAAFPYYFGYIDAEGRWYIEKQNADGSRRHTMSIISPSGRYSDNWNSRAALVYSYWDTWF